MRDPTATVRPAWGYHDNMLLTCLSGRTSTGLGDGCGICAVDADGRDRRGRRPGGGDEARCTRFTRAASRRLGGRGRTRRRRKAGFAANVLPIVRQIHSEAPATSHVATGTRRPNPGQHGRGQAGEVRQASQHGIGAAARQRLKATYFAPRAELVLTRRRDGAGVSAKSLKRW